MVRLVWPGWWLGLLVGIGSPVAAQANVDPPRVELKENYPNPFFPATTIPFEIGQALCARGRQPVVSLKIYNVLVQVVAIPVLAQGSDERVDSLRLRCGLYHTYWNGKYLDGVGEATPGVYYYQLSVNGERYTRKMIVQRKVTSRQ
ncbi:MAG: T9SS type A sorting domain-containing protein [Gemmatimonadales bacterium]